MYCEEFVIKMFIAFGTLNSNNLKFYATSASHEIHRMRANSVESRTEIDYLNGANMSRAKARVESDIESLRTRLDFDAVLVAKSSLQRCV